MNRKLAPCHNPPNNMVVIRLTLVNIVRSFSFDNKNVNPKRRVAETATISGILLVGDCVIPHTINPKKNKAGNKNPANVPLRLPPTEIYKKSFNHVDNEICHL